jgi:hypothetical protein
MTLNTMATRSLDRTTIELVNTVVRLHGSIAVHRIIGMNIDQLTNLGIGRSFFGHSQQVALESVAVNICKLYDLERNYPLSSIPGIIKFCRTEYQSRSPSKELVIFAKKYGHSEKGDDWLEMISATFDKFVADQKIPLGRFRTFRDKFVCHSEYGYTTAGLPSHEAMEDLCGFAHEFYKLVRYDLSGVHPAALPEEAGTSLSRLMEKIGVDAPIYDFEHKTRREAQRAKLRPKDN